MNVGKLTALIAPGHSWKPDRSPDEPRSIPSAKSQEVATNARWIWFLCRYHDHTSNSVGRQHSSCRCVRKFLEFYSENIANPVKINTVTATHFKFMTLPNWIRNKPISDARNTFNARRNYRQFRIFLGRVRRYLAANKIETEGVLTRKGQRDTRWAATREGQRPG